MTSIIPTPLTSGDDHRALGRAVADRIAELPRRPRLVGLGEPMHGEDEFGRVRNALFAALVERVGATAIALETSAWHGRVVDDWVRGGDGDEDEVMATGFTHGFGGSAANRALVRWMREQNRHRPRPEHLRFAAFDGPTEIDSAPGPRPELQVLHDVVHRRTDRAAGLPGWDSVDRLLGPDEPWQEPSAAMDAGRSVGAEPRVRELRTITDDLRWALVSESPRLRREIGADAVDDALLAGRTAAGLLAYHAGMARDVGDEHRWQYAAAVRDVMMAENLMATVRRGPTLAFAQNAHLRAGTVGMSLGPMTLRWQSAGAHLADHLGEDYHVIACALGDAVEHGIPEPEPDTLEGALYGGLPPGSHLLSAPELRHRHYAPRVSPTFRYAPVDDALLDEVDRLLFLRSITPAR